ncbi:winged helix-turn-helix domain-containing protein [Streptomyces chartreusis]|uniref:winged helix-turn-helix domain-containing protein n=1 Tax=Streptomyces chartreusis TaxID=1969 RepID=UPI002E16D54A
MATTRSLSTAPLNPASNAPRHHLRAVDRDEDWGLPRSNVVESLGIDVADLLPPGATWLPAPQHSLPTLPGQPPMIGYLVLVPADHRPPVPTAVDTDAEPLVRIDSVRRTAAVDGRELDLTYLEFELLAHLVANPHRVHSRDQLVTTVWGYGHVGDGRTVDVHIARLRRKLGAEHRDTIRTVRRVGYKYAPPTGR